MSCLQCILQDDIMIFVSKGKQFIDEKSFNIGKFVAHKSIGYLNFSAEIIITCLQNPYFIQKIMPSTIFDKDENGNDSIFIGYNRNGGNLENGTFPTYYCKFHILFGNLFDIRTTTAANTVFYLNGKYIFISRSVINEELYPNSIKIFKNGKLKEKKTIESLMINIYIVTKISDQKCHFIQFTLSNMKGVLNILANAFFSKTVGKVAQNQRESITQEILQSKQQRFENMRETFNLTHEWLNLVSKTMNMPPSNSFPNTFEEFQNRFA